MQVVLDTNIFLSALISPHGSPARIYDAWKDRRFILVTCEQQRAELRQASRYPKLRAILQPHLVGKMLNTMQGAHLISNPRRIHTVADPTDAFLLDLAYLGQVDYLVTGDKRSGLLALQSVGRTTILTAAEFAKVLKV